MANGKARTIARSIAARPGMPGMAVDAQGGAVVDPTANVIALNEAATKRQDDLREKDREISDLQHRHQSEVSVLRAKYDELVGQLREEYQEKIQRAESGRLDSIRQVDREEVAKTAITANTAITTLAKQTTDLATTLSKQVSDTATAAEARSSAQYNDITKRLQAVELQQSEGKGKQGIVDPQLEKLSMLVEQLARNQSTGQGKAEGISASWIALVGAAGLFLTILSIGGIIFAVTRPAVVATAPSAYFAPGPYQGPERQPTGTVTDTRSTTQPR